MTVRAADNFRSTAGTSCDRRRGRPSLLGRRMLGRWLVLFRQSSGAVAALDDRCAPRAAPLSHGRPRRRPPWCARTGFTYGGDRCACGCRRSPTCPTAPGCVATWSWSTPVRLGLAGNRARRERDPPDLPELREPGWASSAVRGVAANYMLLHDNALDRTHFPYVHPHRIHRGYVEGPPPLNIEVTETTVSYSRTFEPAPADRLAARSHRPCGGRPVYAARDRHVRLAGAARRRDGHRRNRRHRVPQPVHPRVHPDRRGAHPVIWRAARSYALDDDAVTERLREVHEGTMLEDQPLLEAIQASGAASATR